MSKRRVHVVSDSEDELSFAEVASPPRNKKTAPKRKISDRDLSDDGEAGERSPFPPDKSPMSDSVDGHQLRAVANVDPSSARSQMSLLCLDMDEDVERTPTSFNVIEAPKRPPRKLHYQMFAFIIDRSPSDHDGLEDYGGYILKRKVIDTFMRMRLDKFQKHHVLVMTCCDEDTDNLSNREQAKALNKHCVEILTAEEVTVDLIQELSKTQTFAPEAEQFSNVVAGLMTAADVISRKAAEMQLYEKTEIFLFSDLKFDAEDSSITKMSRVLSVVLPESQLTVISNPNAIESESYKKNLKFLKNIFEQVEVLSYREAKKKSEEWTMAEQIPTKFGASIKLFDQEIPIEAYLVCNEKNTSILKTTLEKVSDTTLSVQVPESALREDKQLVKLTDDGHYMKDKEDRLLTVNPERAAMAYKFGTTAVPTEKKLTEYVPSEPSHKGYIVRGWYPAHEFALYVSGGKTYRVFPSGKNCSVFDSLLTLCARKGYALLVDYAYQARFDAKPGVLIPHLKKHCFVYYDVVHEDNLNYLPRYDPITSVKPPAQNLKKMCDLIAEYRLDHLELKYDPASQQVIEDCWKSEIGDSTWKFHEKLAQVAYKRDPALLDKTDDFKQNAEGFVRRLTVKRKEDEAEPNDDLIPFNVEPVDDKQIKELHVRDFKSLFAS